MKNGMAVALLLAALCGAGCSLPDSSGGGSPNLLGNRDKAKAADAAETYTILLQTFSDKATHVEMAKKYKQYTEMEAGWTGLYLVHYDDHSELFWGNYPSIEAAQADKNKAKMFRFRNNANVYVYAQAIIVPVPGKEAVGPPQWNIETAPGDFTLVVAVFNNVPAQNYFDRKKDAVAYCKRLRENGYEAYYYHADGQSEVYVGSYPLSGLQITTEEGLNKPLVTDPRAQAILKDAQFEFLAVNGCKESYRIHDPQTKNVTTTFLRPYPVQIPKKKNTKRELTAPPENAPQYKAPFP